ncbi:MAG: alpha/beta hydrolase [Dehalococcoidia bacterium]
MNEQRVTFASGELHLEGALSLPEGAPPFPAVIVCHPHPLYGGSMDNSVVCALTEALSQASFIAFRINFRGVGLSQGRFDLGIGEQEDVEAAITLVSTMKEVDPDRIGLAGYSAGAAFALPVGSGDGRIKAMVAVSPPLDMFDFAYLRHCSKPKLLISGSRDAFTPDDRFLKFCRELPDPANCVIIEGADHFWWGHEPQLASRVSDFFARAL